MWRLFRLGTARPKTPTLEHRVIGRLEFPSGCMLVDDPQCISHAFRIDGIPSGFHSVSLELIRHERSVCQVAKVIVTFAEGTDAESTHIGNVSVDSARIVLVDRSYYERYWMETGPDRLGVVSLARNDRVVKLLKQQFGLDCKYASPGVRAEVIQPISLELEREIESLLKTIPEYAAFPYMHFYVQTNSTFDRANRLKHPWAIVPLDEKSSASMFVVDSGYGDGTYKVNHFAHNGALTRIEIPFIDTADNHV